MTQKRMKVFIIPTTHWDREWVMTFGQFQIRLVNLVDRMLDILEENPEYRFLMDGQTIPLEDYLEIKPENREKLISFIRSGQLVAGPWYVLADQFLENGESTIRNLQLGMKLSRDLGGEPMKMGYIPDSFGSTAGIPMIFSGFGIEYAGFGRGRPYWNEELPHTEFYWQTQDGSTILAANHGYGNGIFLSYPDIWTNIFEESSFHPDKESMLKRFMEEADRQKSRAAAPCLYFSAGVDHMEARESLVGTVDYINRNQEEYELVFGTPYDYMEEVRASAPLLKTYHGEMRGSKEYPLELEGTLTSHMPLKQANDQCEILLQRVVEPLWTMAAVLAGAQYPQGHIRKMWKLLLSNHPHDSICGCSLDQVHRDMQNRYEQIQSIGEYLVKDCLHILTEKTDTRSPYPDAAALMVFNPLGRSHTGHVRTLVRVPFRFRYSAYTLVDKEGKAVAASIRHMADKQKDLESVYMMNPQLASVISKDAGAEKPDDQVFTVLEVDFMAEAVPAMGYKTWWIRPGAAVKVENGVQLCPGGMENALLRVVFQADGTLDLTDRKTGKEYRGLHYFADREDCGDSYQYHGFAIPEEVDSRRFGTTWQPFEVEKHRVTFRGDAVWQLPACMENGKRSSRLVPVPVTQYVTLLAGTNRVEIAVELDNRVKDHSLRMVLDTGLKGDVQAFDHFQILKREPRTEKEEWREEPFQEFVDVSDGNVGLGLTSRGLPAYGAHLTGEGIRLYLTLLRSVGSLGPAAGANYPVPAAQCPGKQRFEYALMPHRGGWEQGDCLGTAMDYRSVLVAEADSCHAGTLPASSTLLEVTPSTGRKLFVSCLKKAEEGTGVITRVWNPGEAAEVEIKPNFQVSGVYEASLDEIPGKAISVPVVLPAKGLKTMLLQRR